MTSGTPPPTSPRRPQGLGQGGGRDKRVRPAGRHRPRRRGAGGPRAEGAGPAAPRAAAQPRGGAQVRFAAARRRRGPRAPGVRDLRRHASRGEPTQPDCFSTNLTALLRGKNVQLFLQTGTCASRAAAGRSSWCGPCRTPSPTPRPPSPRSASTRCARCARSTPWTFTPRGPSSPGRCRRRRPRPRRPRGGWRCLPRARWTRRRTRRPRRAWWTSSGLRRGTTRRR